jgi:hypothetical protein
LRRANFAEALQQMLSNLQELAREFLGLTVAQIDCLLQKFINEITPLFRRYLPFQEEMWLIAKLYQQHRPVGLLRKLRYKNDDFQFHSAPELINGHFLSRFGALIDKRLSHCKNRLIIMKIIHGRNNQADNR